MHWDTIVVGSGAGGLTAAVTLARAGHKVLVLEQHYLPGGWTHSFHLEGYRFSPGVHYIGDLGPGGPTRWLCDGLGLSRLIEFLPLNREGFDHFQISGERFDQPAGVDRWIARLTDRFPHERAGIAQYFATLGHIARELKSLDPSMGPLDLLSLPFRAPTLLRWGTRTLRPLLDRCIRDPLLQSVLCAQLGNHGLPAERVSLPVHALMSAHYFDGGWYPRGGAKAIPQALLKLLRNHGGSIRVRARVKKVCVERHRTTGVELEDGERIEADQVVCNADPAVVYEQLLDARWCKRQRRKVRRTEYSVGLLSAFCAVEMDLDALGYDSGNYWWYRHPDVDATYRRLLVKRLDQVEGLFVSITSLKDPGHTPAGEHTLEMFTFAPWTQFENRPRDDSYRALKDDLGAKMLAAAENVIPGLRQHVKFFALGTPLTNQFYCNVWHGAGYGSAKTPWQVGPFSFSQRGPVDGLHLCGASTLGHGVAGAAMSGLIAAQHVLGLKHPEDSLVPSYA